MQRGSSGLQSCRADWGAGDASAGEGLSSEERRTWGASGGDKADKPRQQAAVPGARGGLGCCWAGGRSRWPQCLQKPSQSSPLPTELIIGIRPGATPTLACIPCQPLSAASIISPLVSSPNSCPARAVCSDWLGQQGETGEVCSVFGLVASGQHLASQSLTLSHTMRGAGLGDMGASGGRKSRLGQAAGLSLVFSRAFLPH